MAEKTFGYARVSTDKQELERQLALLREYVDSEDDIFTDKFTGRDFSRDGFKRLCSTVRKGDTIVVESLSRVGRSAKELLEVLENWQDQGIIFMSIKENIDLSTTTGKLIAQLLSGLAEFEANCIRERVKEGIAVARAKGRIGGRPKTKKEKIDKAFRLYRSKEYSVKELCELCGISAATFYRALREAKDNESSEESSSVLQDGGREGLSVQAANDAELCE